MSTYSITDIIQSTDRHKLYILMCGREELPECIDFVQSQKINTINIGKELATFINGLEDYCYLNIDVFDHIKKLFDKHKLRINNTGNHVLAIYNLGILLEPALQLNTVKLLKEFSKSEALIIIWENQSDISDRLHWPTQKNKFFLDFKETQIKKMQHAI